MAGNIKAEALHVNPNIAAGEEVHQDQWNYVPETPDMPGTLSLSESVLDIHNAYLEILEARKGV